MLTVKKCSFFFGTGYFVAVSSKIETVHLTGKLVKMESQQLKTASESL